MPKLACPCGFVHNLSPIPDDGWRAIRDKDMEAYIKHERAYSDGFYAPEGSPEREASDIAGRETVRIVTLLHECPQCGRIMWQKAEGENYHIYLPEDEVTRVQALALAAATEITEQQDPMETEAIRIHNEAAHIVAERMSSHGLRCPHCFEFSKQMDFLEGHSESAWSHFRCPACSQLFKLERFKQIRDERKG